MSSAHASLDKVIQQNAARWAELVGLMPAKEEAEGAAAGFLREYRTEAAYKLIMNHEAVLRDITNPEKTNIIGDELTQAELKRVVVMHAGHVDELLMETSRRLLGRVAMTPIYPNNQQPPQQQKVWAVTAMFLSARLQSAPLEMPSRKPDMSEQAALAMRAVLLEVGRIASGV